MGRFLHYISEITGQFQLTASVHNINFHFKRFAANAGPGKTGNQANLIGTSNTVGQEFPNPQEAFQIGSRNGDSLRNFLRNDLYCSLPANLAKRTLQITDTGFPRIAGNDLANGFICDPQLRLFQSMLYKLLGYQMIFCNHQLLFIRIGIEFNDFHSVQQRSGNGIQRVGCCYEQHIGQIIRNFQIVVTVSVILLAIQYFQKSGTGISTIVRTHFVDLIQKEERVAATCLDHGIHDPSRHCAHISLPMTADIRLVMNTTQRNACHFPVQTSCNRIRNGSFAHAGRSHQADNLGGHLRSKLANRDNLQNTLLHLFKTKMIMIQYFSGCLNIHSFFGCFVPGQFQNNIQIIAQNSTLRRTKGLLFKAVNILQQLLFVFFR